MSNMSVEANDSMRYHNSVHHLQKDEHPSLRVNMVSKQSTLEVSLASKRKLEPETPVLGMRRTPAQPLRGSRTLRDAAEPQLPAEGGSALKDTPEKPQQQVGMGQSAREESNGLDDNMPTRKDLVDSLDVHTKMGDVLKHPMHDNKNSLNKEKQHKEQHNIDLVYEKPIRVPRGQLLARANSQIAATDCILLLLLLQEVHSQANDHQRKVSRYIFRSTISTKRECTSLNIDDHYNRLVGAVDQIHSSLVHYAS